MNNVVVRELGTCLIALLVLPSMAFASDTACALLEPPAGAGEIAYSTATTSVSARVFPRLSDLPINYSGCQVLWAAINGNKTRTVVYVKEGRVESTDPAPDTPLCAKGEKTSETGCYPRKWALQATFPAGCLAKAVNGQHTPECLESFRKEHRLLDAIVD